MSKIQATFERLQAQGRKALIPFITAGDPDPALTVPLMRLILMSEGDDAFTGGSVTTVMATNVAPRCSIIRSISMCRKPIRCASSRPIRLLPLHMKPTRKTRIACAVAYGGGV